MLSLATLPRAPPAALYNPLEHGHHLSENQVVKGKVYSPVPVRNYHDQHILSHTTNLRTFNSL